MDQINQREGEQVGEFYKKSRESNKKSGSDLQEKIGNLQKHILKDLIIRHFKAPIYKNTLKTNKKFYRLVLI